MAFGSGNAEGVGFGGWAALRVLRLARLARILRLFLVFKELWLFVSGIVAALRELHWVTPLITLNKYIFATFLTRMLDQMHQEDPHIDLLFGTILRSKLTLFQTMTTEGWADLARDATEYDPRAKAFFVVYLPFTTFAVTNVVVAVIVENTASTALKETEDIVREQ